MQGRILDDYDCRILDCLQRNGRLTNVELSTQVFLSPSQCQRRVKRLEEEGIIQGYSALLSPEAVGLGVLAFVSVSLAMHGENPARAFTEAIRDIPEILECHAVTGEADYLLRVAAPDLKSFSDFLLHRLMRVPGVTNVRSTIALEELKRTIALPLRKTAKP
ncbi:Lrp/AsnC family transcriptional regulator [Telmatospirillum sp. J64-1]|uniref:Lrp/AsnC family transcriptional regulator n=1 Tax=Telmatospirillum sp. J64-1 TaxID=2502183 RepID=UPI00115DB6D5|nr:Lrp/AsnC family transcriptional regulator [Telmatospirillum sp. J64-1]